MDHAAALDAVLTDADISSDVRRFIADIGPESYPKEWEKIRTATFVTDAKKLGADCDDQALLDYTRLILAEEIARRGKFAELPGIVKARDLYFERHVVGSRADYAPGETFLPRRIEVGLSRIQDLTRSQQQEIWVDIDLLVARAERHEFTRADVQRVHDALGQMLLRTKDHRDRLQLEIDRLRTTLSGYARGPAHMEALEQQWLAYKAYHMVTRDGSVVVGDRALDTRIGALQRATISALKAAEAYCWAPHTAQLVAAVGAEMPGECAGSETALGDLAASGTAGWWWFQEPIPVKTVKSAEGRPDQPVQALLWRRELHGDKMVTWMSTLVLDSFRIDGRFRLVPTPSLAWVLTDGVRLRDIRATLTAGYSQDGVIPGIDDVTTEEAVAASEWFSRFFLAGCMWLRQRVVVTEPGQGLRQVSRAIQREHRLDVAPKVQIVELRRRDAGHQRRQKAEGEEPTREYSCRWMVRGHTRNQWYASRGEHAPKWIEAHMAGPDDKPLREVQRVYVVRR